MLGQSYFAFVLVACTVLGESEQMLDIFAYQQIWYA